MATVRFLTCPKPSGPTAGEVDDWPVPPITGPAAAEALLVFRALVGSRMSPCAPPPPIPLDDPPIDARLGTFTITGHAAADKAWA